MRAKLTIHPLTDLPLVQEGDDLAALIRDALLRADIALRDGDIVVVAQKIVSKAEGRKVRLADVDPSPEALEIALEVEKDPRLVELILKESKKIVRKAPGVIIVQHRLGIVCANAGIDQSNVEQEGGECALLLPENPDRSAKQLREALLKVTRKRAGVIISDSINRPWRLGTVGIAVGSAGLTVLDDRRGQSDLFGRELQVTMSNRADALATAAMLVMGETTERVPVAVVQGLAPDNGRHKAGDSIRPAAEDLFL